MFADLSARESHREALRLPAVIGSLYFLKGIHGLYMALVVVVELPTISGDKIGDNFLFYGKDKARRCTNGNQ